MPFINPCHRGLAYGDGHIQGEGALGQVVAIAGNDLFAVNTDPSVRSFGVLIKDYASGDMPGEGNLRLMRSATERTASTVWAATLREGGRQNAKGGITDFSGQRQ